MNSNFEAGLFDELDAIYPDTDICQGKSSYWLDGANGTYAGVHIAMNGLTPGIPVSIEVQGPSTSYKIFRLIPLPVEVNTGAKLRSEYMKADVNPYVIRRAPFMIYEVYEPIFNIFMPSLTTAALAFKYPIEYCREKRTNKWKFLIKHGDVTKELELFVVEYPVNVPKAGKETYQYTNWLYFDKIAEYHHVEKWSAQYLEILSKYCKAAVYSRQNMLNIQLTEFFDKDSDGTLHLNEKKLDTIVNIAQKAGISWLSGDGFASRALSLSDNDEFYNTLPHETIENADEISEIFKRRAFEYFDHGTEAVFSLTKERIPGSGVERLRDAATQIYEYLVKRELTDCWYQSCMDEPNEALNSTYRIISEVVHQCMPGIPVLEPVLEAELSADCVDIICPSVDIYEENYEFYREQTSLGKRVFVYTCLTPGGNYCNRLLDMERLRAVWLGWAPMKYKNVSGYLHWGGNAYCSGNPFKRQAAMFCEQVLEFHPKRSMFLPAGDDALFFPGEKEPWITTRSEAHRIGYEDLCILKDLEKVQPQKTEELVDAMFRSYSDYEKDISKYRETKKKLLLAAVSAAEKNGQEVI